MRKRIAIATAACGLLALGAGGCGGGREGAGADEGDCATNVRYGGGAYVWTQVEVAPEEGRPVGEAGLYCSLAADAAPERMLALAEIAGVTPEVALAWHGHADMVFVREGLEPLPPDVRRLMRAPTCDPRDEPIRLAGPWLGIRGVVEEELDLVPPYDVDLLAEESSVPRYERAFLAVRVPKTLGQPLTRADVRDSLRGGGTLSLAVSCWLDGRFVAERIEAQPPENG